MGDIGSAFAEAARLIVSADRTLFGIVVAEPRGEPYRGRRRDARSACRSARRSRSRAFGAAMLIVTSQRAHGPAARCRGPRRLPVAVSRGTARRARAALHAHGHGDRADDTDHTDHRGPFAADARRCVARVRRAAALARRGTAHRGADIALGHALLARHDRAGGLRARRRGSGRRDDRRRQYRRGDARDDDRHRAGDEQGGSAARARPGTRPDRAGACDQRRGSDHQDRRTVRRYG